MNGFNDERFEAVARLLHTSRQTSVDAIKQALQRLGEQEELLTQPLKGRDKKNFFKADGKSDMEQLIGRYAKDGKLEKEGAVDQLANKLRSHQLEKDAQAWRIGLQLLAARIAGPARQKAQERR